MWPDRVVISPPFFSALSGFFQREEPVLVEALLPHPSMECLDERIVGGRGDWTPTSPVSVRPGIERLGGDLGTVVDLQDLRQSSQGRQPLQDRHDTVSSERAINLERWALTTHDIHSRYEPEALSVRQAVAHEVHTPVLVRGLGGWGRKALARCLRTLERTESPSKRSSRYTRLWLTRQPSRRSTVGRRRDP
jgi:hypothetical protein